MSSFLPYFTPPPTLPSTRHHSRSPKCLDECPINQPGTYTPIQPRPDGYLSIPVTRDPTPHPPSIQSPPLAVLHPLHGLTVHSPLAPRTPTFSIGNCLTSRDPSPSSRAEKRRRTRSSINTSSTATKTHTPTQSHVHSRSSPSDSSILLPPPSRRKHSNQLPPINLGFAASRENRREVGNDSGLGGEGGPYEHSLPSPVVMGFDYKAIDEQQLKTVSVTSFLP